MSEFRGIRYLEQVRKGKVTQQALYEDRTRTRVEEISMCIDQQTEKFFDRIMYQLGQNYELGQTEIEGNFNFISHNDKQNFGIIYNILNKFKASPFDPEFFEELNRAWKTDSYWSSLPNREDLFVRQVQFQDLYQNRLYMTTYFELFSFSYFKELCQVLGEGKISASMEQTKNDRVLSVKAILDPNSIGEQPAGFMLVKDDLHPDKQTKPTQAKS